MRFCRDSRAGFSCERAPRTGCFSPAFQAQRPADPVWPVQPATYPRPAESAWAVDGATTLTTSAGDATAAWKLNDFKYTVDKNDEGEYVVEVDTLFAVESITDYLTGNIVPTTDYDVVYFQRGGSSDDQQTTTVQSVTQTAGGVPNVVGDYTMAIVKGDLKDFDSNGTTAAGDDFSSATKLTELKNFKDKETNESIVVIEVPFTVAPKTVSLEGAFAYEDNANDAEDFSDTSFKYLAKDIKFGFSVDGEQVDLTNLNVSWIQDPSETLLRATASSNEFTIPAEKVVAGTYTAKLTPKESVTAGHPVYSSSITVSFEIKPIDLSKDEVAIAPTTSLAVKGGGAGTSNSKQIDLRQLLVNGEAYGQGASGIYQDADADNLGISAEIVARPDGVQLSSINATNITANSTNAGPWTVKISDASTSDPNIVGSSQLVEAVVVHEKVVYEYKGDTVDSTAANDIDIALAYGDVFNPDFLSASYNNGTTIDFDWKLVDAKGNEVAPADLKDGEYTLYLSTDWFKMEGKYYAGYEAVDVHVTGPNYDDAVAFISVDDLFLNGTAKNVEYTGEAFEVSVVAKNGSDKLVEGEDYSVSVADSKGNAVDSILEIGEYVVTVEFADGNEVEGKINVTKADIESAKATADFFALPADGSAATPTFVGSTNDDFKKGQQFDLAADEISVEYYEVEWDHYAGAGTEQSPYVYGWVKAGDALSADELTEEGTYAAVINVKTTAKHIESKATLSAFEYFDATKSNANAGVVVEDSLVFKVSEAVAFSDVDANAWYAESVYSAADFGYMTGIDGTKLFMPESDITRAQVAEVFFKMAGGEKDATKEYPSKFSDVEANAWYAQAISWASQAGIVGGYEGTDVFGTFDNATREQIATMIYRYAKAQGMDVTVEDEAKALSAYTDADQLTYGKTAMAWCVEQGIFGVDVDSLRPADNMSRAEMAATAVRVQPDGAKQDL